MATQVQPSKDEVTRARKVAVTSVRVLPETKEALDRLLEIRGVETFDDLIYDLVRDHLEPGLGLQLPPRATTPRELAARVAQIEEALRRLEVDLLVTDPKTGIVFNPIRGASVERAQKGSQVNRKHLLEDKFFKDESEAGVQVKLPLDDTWHATERDGDLPPAVIEHVKMEGKKEKDRAPIAPRGRYFREPPAPPTPAAPPAPPAPAKGAGKKGGDAS